MLQEWTKENMWMNFSNSAFFKRDIVLSLLGYFSLLSQQFCWWLRSIKRESKGHSSQYAWSWKCKCKDFIKTITSYCVVVFSTRSSPEADLVIKTERERDGGEFITLKGRASNYFTLHRQWYSRISRSALGYKPPLYINYLNKHKYHFSFLFTLT